jgi:hypothetical protein
MAAPLDRELAGRVRNPLAAVPGDAAKRDHDIGRDQKLAMALLHVAVGIKALGILPHHNEIKRAEGVAHAGIGPRGAQIGEQIEILPEIFRGIDLARALVLEIGCRSRPEDQAVGIANDFQQARPNGRTEFLQACVTDRMFFDLNVQLKALGSRAQDIVCRRRNLRPDAVTRQ